MVNQGEMNLLWATLLVEELTRLQVGLFAIAPGSRSGPLTVAVALNSKARAVVHLDERGLGFYALGHAKATGKPAVIITTSGSAVANLMPAIVEASLDNIPLIVLTADRPPELCDTSANQTLDQVKFFGTNVRWFFDIPSPTTESPLAMLLTTADQACHYATLPTNKGPVHLNCHFPEPLLPAPDHKININHLPRELHAWHKSPPPYTQIFPLQTENNDHDYHQCAKLISTAKSGLVVLGKIDDPAEEESIATLLKALKWPVFPDIASQFMGTDTGSAIISKFDLALLSTDFQNDLNPDIILHIGGRITSKRLSEFIAKHSAHYIKIQNTIQRDDEHHTVTLRYTAITPFCKKMAPLLGMQKPLGSITALSSLSDKISKEIKAITAYNELGIVCQLSSLIPARHSLFIGNSMPIRNLQMASVFEKGSPRIFVNRGASGIDGLIATACGCAEGTQAPTTAIVGDVSALHDLNSLMLVTRSTVPVILIIINNDGGEIFSFLPISNWNKLCTPYFTTPHGHNFQSFSEGFGINYYKPKTLGEFATQYKQALTQKASTVIECIVDQKSNVKDTQLFQDLFR